MNRRITFAAALVVLSIALLAGCSHRVEQGQDATEAVSVHSSIPLTESYDVKNKMVYAVTKIDGDWVTVELFLDGECIGRSAAQRWRHHSDTNIAITLKEGNNGKL